MFTVGSVDRSIGRYSSVDTTYSKQDPFLLQIDSLLSTQLIFIVINALLIC